MRSKTKRSAVLTLRGFTAVFFALSMLSRILLASARTEPPVELGLDTGEFMLRKQERMEAESSKSALVAKSSADGLE